jgi:hypothetical protein
MLLWTVGAAASGVRPATTESTIHLFSIGYETLVLEVWADTNAGM